MYILGLHNAEDAGVALMRDGAIVDVLNEERLSRDKLHLGFPELSLKWVLEKNRITLGDVDHIVYGWHGRQNDYPDYARKLVRRVVSSMNENPLSGPILVERVDTEFSRMAETRDAFEARMAELGVPASKIVFLDHHLSHSWGAFACSPFEEAIVFTFDGRGDLKSTTVSYADPDSGVVEKDYLLSMDSIGFLYGQITHYLGYKAHRHEGKVTGLAAFGQASRTLPLFRRLMSFDDGVIHAHLGIYKPFYTSIHPSLRAELDAFSREDVAAGLQAHCEHLVASYVDHWRRKIDRPGNRHVCLSGGVAANVKINQRVAELPGVDNVFVFPHMGDGGLTLSSACYQHFRVTGRTKVVMDGVYFGPAYSNEEIAAVLHKHGSSIVWERLENRVGACVDDLVGGRVVGWFDGRMEFGPRALGARSIMYHTRDASVNDWLNKRMRRTEFMPFAPVTPHEYAADCYVGWREDDSCTPYMTKTFDCTSSFREIHKAVVHIDGTARPQTVTAARNGDYYNVIKAYCDRTGERALINTSFNAHEEPIVCSPADAVHSLIDGVVDVLYAGDFRAVARRP